MKTIRLQGLGLFTASEAREVEVDDILIWNYGEEEKIVSIDKETEKSIWVTCEYVFMSETKTATRRMLKTRAVKIKRNGEYL